MRGKAVFHIIRCSLVRITPAHAGKRSPELLKNAGYDTSSADALKDSFEQRAQDITDAKEAAEAENRKRISRQSVGSVYRNADMQDRAATLPTGTNSVELAEAQRQNFKAQSTIKNGRVELQLSMLKTNSGLSTDAQLNQARSALTKEAQRKLTSIEKLADALNMDVVVHDVMTGANGYYDADGKIHFVLSSRLSVPRVAAHELTHKMKADARTQYDAVRDQLIRNVGGQERFEALMERKLKEYGFDLENETNRELCEDEVVAELCEGMLSDTTKLESFAERHLEAAKTLKDRLVKILNAIKQALKGVGDYANEIYLNQKVVDKWLDGLDAVIAKAEERQNTLEGGIAAVAGVSTEQQESAAFNIDPLYLEESAWKDGSIYDYDFLVKQNPTQVVEVEDDVPMISGTHNVDTDAVVSIGMENAKENGRMYKDVCLVENSYSGKEIRVTNSALKHGLGGSGKRIISNAKAAERAGEIIKNSIPINGLKNQSNAEATYAMAGVMRDSKRTFVVITTVEKRSNQVSDMKTYDLAHAMNTRIKNESAAGIFHPQGVTPSTTPEYSIQDFLQLVNNTHKSILSESVLKALGETRPENGTYTNEVMFALDSVGRELSEGQQEYFKDSVIRDEQGRLKVMYRGGRESFTVFDRKKASHSNLYGRGFYFTDSENYARQYGDARAYYLKVTNPVSTEQTTITRAQLRKFIKAVEQNEDYGLDNYGYGSTVDSVLKKVYGSRSDFAMLYDIDTVCVGDMVATVELFNEVNGTNYDGFILPTETVVFSSEQI